MASGHKRHWVVYHQLNFTHISLNPLEVYKTHTEELQGELVPLLFSVCGCVNSSVEQSNGPPSCPGMSNWCSVLSAAMKHGRPVLTAVMVTGASLYRYRGHLQEPRM